MDAAIGRVYLVSGNEVGYVESLRIVQTVNQHAVAKVTVFVKEKEAKQASLEISQGTVIKLNYVIQDGKEKKSELLFEGMPLQVRVENRNGIHTLFLRVVSKTFEMDIEKKDRSFQDINVTYRDLVKNIVTKEYEGQCIFQGKVDQKTAIPYIQYGETDWEFLKRTLSRVDSFLIPNMSNEKIQLFVGFPKRNKKKLEEQKYTIIRDGKEYEEALGNGESVAEEAYTSYCVRSYQNLNLCDEVDFLKSAFIVWKKETVFQDEALVFYYTLKKKEAWKQVSIWNENLTGVTLQGELLEVKDNKVKLHLSIDESQDKEKAYWYSYAASYVSENQTGTYHMPEKGEQLLLRIPSEREECAYATCVKRGDGDSNDKTSDPGTKYFESVDGKYIKLTEDTLSVIPTDGISIELTDSGGIDIKSSGKMEIQGEKEISLSGKVIKLDGTDAIEIVTPGASLREKDTIHIYAPSGGTRNG